MEAYFGTDTKRINHARQVLSFADEIMAKKNYIIAELGNMKFKPRYKSPFGGQKFYNLYEQALDRLQAWAKYNDASSNIKI